jgi:hypothetical protein
MDREQIQRTVNAFDVRHLTAGDANAIDRMVGREHVAEPARLVARRIADRIKCFRKLDRGLQAAILRHARKSHFRNRKVFTDWRF